jgi:hypothetical protein
VLRSSRLQLHGEAQGLHRASDPTAESFNARLLPE